MKNYTLRALVKDTLRALVKDTLRALVKDTLASARAPGDDVALATTLANIASHYSDAGDLGRGVQLQEKAVTVAERAATPRL